MPNDKEKQITSSVGDLGFTCYCGEPIHAFDTKLYDCPKCGRQIDVKIHGSSGHLIIEVDKNIDTEVNRLKLRSEY